MDAQTKERLISELHDYLDTLPESWTAPDTGERVDLYRLFTELAGLRAELALQARQFKSALDEFRNVFDTLESGNRQLQRELETRREHEASVQQAAQRPLLLEFIELRERLEQAHRLATGHRRSRLRIGARREHTLIAGLAEGLEIMLRRLDQSLADYEVRPVQALGQTVDPHTMRVSGVRQAPGQPDGIVLEETRRGYLQDGHVLRLAEVVASKQEPNP